MEKVHVINGIVKVGDYCKTDILNYDGSLEQTVYGIITEIRKLKALQPTHGNPDDPSNAFLEIKVVVSMDEIDGYPPDDFGAYNRAIYKSSENEAMLALLAQ